MEINYYGGTLLSPAFKELCDKKLAKLEKFVPNSVVDVNLSIVSKEHILKMIIKNNGNQFVASSKNDDMYKNIDDCVFTLKNQIIKNKDYAHNKKTHVKEEINFI